MTEGEDKPLKYPLAFNTSHVAVVTKIDIAQAVGYDRQTAQRASTPGESGHPRSSRSRHEAGAGMDEWIELLDGPHSREGARPDALIAPVL